MILEQTNQSNDCNGYVDFDATMAKLLVLMTHHSLTKCPNAVQAILDHLEVLFHQDEIDFFPEQRQVLIKMHKLWLLEQAKGQKKH